VGLVLQRRVERFCGRVLFSEVDHPQPRVGGILGSERVYEERRADKQCGSGNDGRELHGAEGYTP